MPKLLNQRQQMFVTRYLKHENGQKAATEAGYSAKSAEVQASRLLRHVGVRDAILKAKQHATETTQVDAAWLLNRLAELAEVDILDLLDKRGDIRKLEDIPSRARRLIAGLEIEALYAGTGDDRVQIGHVRKIKLLDRLRVYDQIGRHVDVSAFQSEKETVVPVLVIRDFTGMAPRQVEEGLEALRLEAKTDEQGKAEEQSQEG